MESIINDLKKNPTDVIKNLTQSKYKKLLTHLLKSYHTDGISLISDALYDIIIEKYVEKYGYFSEMEKLKPMLYFPNGLFRLT